MVPQNQNRQWTVLQNQNRLQIPKRPTFRTKISGISLIGSLKHQILNLLTPNPQWKVLQIQNRRWTSMLREIQKLNLDPNLHQKMNQQEANLEMRAHNLVASLDRKMEQLEANRDQKMSQLEANLEKRTHHLDPNLDRKTQQEANRDRKMDLLEANPPLLTPWMDL